MAQYRCLIEYSLSTSLSAEDNVVNTFYLDTDALSGADDPQGLIEDAVELFRLYRSIPAGFNQVRGRIYNMAHVEPRQPVGTATAAFAPGGASAPREVALCLSYYAGSNIPRKRGRMYIGPWTGSLSERPAAVGHQDKLADLATGISNLGGINVQWVQYSPTTKQFSNVTNWWVDNEWDTVRSRGLKGTSRLSGTVSG